MLLYKNINLEVIKKTEKWKNLKINMLKGKKKNIKNKKCENFILFIYFISNEPFNNSNYKYFNYNINDELSFLKCIYQEFFVVLCKKYYKNKWDKVKIKINEDKRK